MRRGKHERQNDGRHRGVDQRVRRGAQLSADEAAAVRRLLARCPRMGAQALGDAIGRTAQEIRDHLAENADG